MTPVLLAIAAILLFLGLGFPLALVLLGVGLTGFALVHPGGFTAGLAMTGGQISEFALSPTLAVLPLFVLMGSFITRAEIADDLYEVFYKWMGHVRGGLAMATVGSCAGFAAVSGSSLATAATMTKVAVPVMRRYKYSDSFSAGTVAAGGTLGILIPPSALIIIYGILAEVDIGKMFVAALIPAVLTVAIYMLVVRVVVTIRPDAGPAGPSAPWSERLSALWKTWGILALFAIIMGGIFFGIFTASEAGSIGAVGALVFAIIRGKMNMRIFVDCLFESARMTATLFSVAIGALVLNQFVNFSGFPGLLLDFINGLGSTPGQVIFMILAIYVVMGMFIDGPAIIFLTVPIFVPVLAGMGIDLIWWGIVTVMIVEISLITPPIGLNVFVIKSTLPEVPLTRIFKGILPFFAGDLLRLALVVLFPALALWLPGVM